MAESFHKDISDSVIELLEDGHLDDAVFAAMKYLEERIQKRIGSKRIGEMLIEEAFYGSTPKIHISDDNRSSEGIWHIFKGALKFVRNDRGHKGRPEIPCPGEDACRDYLHFVSMLHRLLDEDKNLAPRIVAIRVAGATSFNTIEIYGKNFSEPLEVTVGEVPLKIIYHDQTEIHGQSAKPLKGDVVAVSSGRKSNAMYCDSEEPPPTSYLVLDSNLPLYMDQECNEITEDFVGCLVECREHGRCFERLYPVRKDTIPKNVFITHGPYGRESIEKAWYRHPRTNQLETPWNGSIIPSPEIIGRKEDEKMVGL